MSQKTAGERTEKATPRKRKEARERGQVRKSNEVNTALALLIMFGVWQVFGGGILQQMKGLLLHFFSPGVAHRSLTQANAGVMLQDAVLAFIITLSPVLIAAVLAALLVNFLQTGLLFSSKAAKPKLNRISPLQGFKRIFSTRSLMQLGKSILKMVVLGLIAYSEIEQNLGVFSNMMAGNVVEMAGQIISAIMGLAFKLGIALAIIAGFDYVYQWWKYEKDLRMTKQEVKDEYKRVEGDRRSRGGSGEAAPDRARAHDADAQRPTWSSRTRPITPWRSATKRAGTRRRRWSRRGRTSSRCGYGNRRPNTTS